MTDFPLPYTQKPNTQLLEASKRAAILSNPGFGQSFTDNMVSIDWHIEQGWKNARVEAFAPLTLSPSTTVFHYGQEIFEGMKAYRHEDGSVHVFRPDRHAKRFRKSAERMSLPQLPTADFIESIRQYVTNNVDWVPSGAEKSLYMRPFLFANEAKFGLHATLSAEYHVIGSPAASYFKAEDKPIRVWVETKFARASKKGTGMAKTGGNYAAAMIASQRAYAEGCDQALFVDSEHGAYLEELSSMNIFLVDKEGGIRTPKLDGSILDGVTRNSVIQLARDLGHRVAEERLSLHELLEEVRSGYIREMFATGTAGVVTPIGGLKGEGFELNELGATQNTITHELRTALTDIHYGRAADHHQWLMRVA